MTFNTGNPVGSTDARDLYDNAQNLDKFANGEELEYPDRLGRPRKSLVGIHAEVTEALSRLGYHVKGEYAAGLVVENYGEVFRKDGEFYRAKAETTLPYPLNGDWAVDAPKFVSVGDAVLRQDLATADGADMVGYKGRTVADKLGDVANIMDYGAVADGVTDDAPALRAAMAALVAKGGGYLYLPAGTYYLNSGDPRGLAMLPITGKNEFYTVCEIGDGVTVYGDGDATVIKYESNRVGEFLNPDGAGVYRGDVGALFANFRVRANNNTPYTVGSFHVRDFKVLYTPLLNQTKDYIDGQVVRIYSNSGAVSSGSFSATNINVSNCPGHQIFSYEKIDSFEGIGNRIYSPGYLSNPANSDHSCFFVSGARAVYQRNLCFGSVPDKNSTFIESHCAYNDVSSNYCYGMATFVNAVSQVVHPGAAYDYSRFMIAGNYAWLVRTFAVDFCYADNRKAYLELVDNNVLLQAGAATDVESLLRYANDNGAGTILPTGVAIIRGNLVAVSNTYVGQIDYETSFDALINHPHITHLVVEGNEVRNSRRAVLNIGGTAAGTVRVANNRMIDCCANGNSANDSSGRASRSVIMVTLVPGNILERVEIEDNVLGNAYFAGGAEPSYAVLVANFYGADAPTAFSVKRNSVVKGTTHNVFFDAGANSHASDSIDIDHRHSVFDAASTYGALVLCGASVASINAGSVGRYLDVTALMVGSGGSKSPKVEAHGSAAPVARYWFVGNVMHNTAPAPSGAMGWVCTAAGTPGTWKAFGTIAA